MPQKRKRSHQEFQQNTKKHNNIPSVSSTSPSTAPPPQKKQRTTQRIRSCHPLKNSNKSKSITIYYQIGDYTKKQINNILSNTIKGANRPLLLFPDNDIDHYYLRIKKNGHFVTTERQNIYNNHINTKLCAQYDDIYSSSFLSQGIVVNHYKYTKTNHDFNAFRLLINSNFNCIHKLIKTKQIKEIIIPSKYPVSKQNNDEIFHNIEGTKSTLKQLQYIQYKINELERIYAKKWIFTDYPVMYGNVKINNNELFKQLKQQNEENQRIEEILKKRKEEQKHVQLNKANQAQKAKEMEREQRLKEEVERKEQDRIRRVNAKRKREQKEEKEFKEEKEEKTPCVSPVNNGSRRRFYNPINEQHACGNGCKHQHDYLPHPGICTTPEHQRLSQQLQQSNELIRQQRARLDYQTNHINRLNAIQQFPNANDGVPSNFPNYFENRPISGFTLCNLLLTFFVLSVGFYIYSPNDPPAAVMMEAYNPQQTQTIPPIVSDVYNDDIQFKAKPSGDDIHDNDSVDQQELDLEIGDKLFFLCIAAALLIAAILYSTGCQLRFNLWSVISMVLMLIVMYHIHDTIDSNADITQHINQDINVRIPPPHTMQNEYIYDEDDDYYVKYEQPDSEPEPEVIPVPVVEDNYVAFEDMPSFNYNEVASFNDTSEYNIDWFNWFLLFLFSIFISFIFFRNHLIKYTLLIYTFMLIIIVPLQSMHHALLYPIRILNNDNTLSYDFVDGLWWILICLLPICLFSIMCHHTINWLNAGSYRSPSPPIKQSNDQFNQITNNNNNSQYILIGKFIIGIFCILLMYNSFETFLSFIMISSVLYFILKVCFGYNIRIGGMSVAPAYNMNDHSSFNIQTSNPMILPNIIIPMTNTNTNNNDNITLASPVFSPPLSPRRYSQRFASNPFPSPRQISNNPYTPRLNSFYVK